MSNPVREIAPRLLSVQEYARLEEPDEYRSELVEGVLVREPRPGARHGKTQLRIAQALYQHVERQRLGHVFTDVGVVIQTKPRTVRGPDVAFYALDRVPDPIPEGFLTSAPDLAIEVVSPSTTVSGLVEKVTEYLTAGSRLVWVVDPKSRTATVYRSREDIRILTDDEVLDGGDVVRGFRTVLRDVLP